MPKQTDGSVIDSLLKEKTVEKVTQEKLDGILDKKVDHDIINNIRNEQSISEVSFSDSMEEKQKASKEATQKLAMIQEKNEASVSHGIEEPVIDYDKISTEPVSGLVEAKK